ncbi:hypothetical protein [uncultured Microbulbifer sp.]|uniref:hypothetical protein n=1 Tax=uncultured Microbulbifer sp. TaxID=348147 RepID=UPI002635A7E8|nr:hypothetical protein [uncultured Microbulbifer sp.]
MNFFPTKSLVSVISLAVALGSTMPASSQIFSSAQSQITLSFVQSIDITNVDNLDITPVGTNDATAVDDFCVAGSGFPTFGITFGSASEPFILANANGVPLAYNVDFANSLVGTLNPVMAGVVVPNQTIQVASCTALNNARFQVTIPASEWVPVQNEGPFIGTLSILVASE